MKRILFVCGTGGITSTVAERYVTEKCQEAGVAVTTVRCTPTEVESNLNKIDLIVSTTYLQGNFPVEVVNGLALITGIGKDNVLNEIIKRLNVPPA